MHKKILILLGLFVFVGANAQQQTTANTTQASQAARPIGVSASDTSVQSGQDSMDDSFAAVAELGQKIEMANKQIEAEQLQSKLDAMKQASTARDLGFSVYQVLGFDKTLNVVFMTTNGAMLTEGPGEMINNIYRVSLITPKTVKVVDVSANKTFTVPFYKPNLETNKQTTMVQPDMGASGGISRPTLGDT